MGGVLVLTTLDHLQLQPIRARPALLSTLVITSFRMIKMEHSVRARSDLPLQRVICISRHDVITSEDSAEFRYIIIHHCRHVTNWQDPAITPDMIRVLGTRQGVINTEKAYYKDVEQKKFEIVTRSAETIQAVLSSHGNWKTAEESIVQRLDKEINEVQMLRLHKYLIVEFTYNKSNCWSHAQIGIIMKLPSQDTLNNWKPIHVMLAPPGVRELPGGECSRSNLRKNGWKEVHVGTAPEIEHRMSSNITAKRKQYGIRPRLAMTIHKAMGGDFGKIVTQVGQCNDGYRLWSKEQVIVLLSRTHQACDIMFVGESPEHTADVLVEMLFKVSPYTAYMNHVVEQMTNSDTIHIPVIHPLQYLPYNVRHTIIPTETNGFVYLLMSLQDYSTTYIGQTKNLVIRLNQHNSGIGSHVSANVNLRPWHCIAFVTGFVDNTQQERMSFELAWQNCRNRLGKYVLNPWDVLRVGKELVASKNCIYGMNQLHFTQCLEFKARRDENSLH